MATSHYFRVAPTALFQPVADESVLLDMATEKYFSLDSVGTRMWQLVTEYGDVESVVAKLLEEYDASADQLRADVSALTEKLTEAGLLVRESQG